MRVDDERAAERTDTLAHTGQTARAAGKGAGDPDALDTSTVTPPPISPRSRLTFVSTAPACLTTFVSASWTIR